MTIQQSMGAKRDESSFRALLRALRSRIEKPLYAHGLRPTRSLTLPAFLGIGAQKAGTTWLHANLQKHPQLFLPNIKELHYFDWHFTQPLSAYAAHFLPANGRVAGEITPHYCALSHDRIAFIRRIMPDLRLILLLRNPIERAWSRAVMVLAKNRNRSAADIPDDEFIREFSTKPSIRRGNYPEILDRWLAEFPPQQLFVGFYNDITDRPQSLLAEIFKHLGVSTDVDWSEFPYDQVVYEGQKAQMPDRVHRALVDMYRKDIEVIYQRFGERVEHWRC